MKRHLSLALLFITAMLTAQSEIVKEITEFSEVKTFDLINVTMIKSDENKVVITGKNKKDVTVLTKNGTLKIRMNIEEVYDGSNTKVILYYTKVDIIDANEGSEITVNDTLKQQEIELKAQEGGIITAVANTSHTFIRAVTGGVINLTGSSKAQDITIFTGGLYNGSDFLTNNTAIKVNAGGEAHINASEKAQVKIRAGGDVFVYGNPKGIDEKRVLGGRVKHM